MRIDIKEMAKEALRLAGLIESKEEPYSSSVLCAVLRALAEHALVDAEYRQGVPSAYYVRRHADKNPIADDDGRAGRWQVDHDNKIRMLDLMLEDYVVRIFECAEADDECDPDDLTDAYFRPTSGEGTPVGWPE